MPPKPSANIFLLTHKCGNNYIESCFRRDSTFSKFQSDDIKGEMPGPYIGESPIPDRDFLNIRCRNFDPISISRLLKGVDVKTSRFFLFTRHPGSFFKSAAAYHLRGGEEWACTNRYPYLNGRTLHDSLRLAAHPDQKLLICMKHFGLSWRLLDRWVQNHKFLLSLGAEFYVIKTEDLFASTSRDYYRELAEKMSHNSYSVDPDVLMSSSPAFMKELPGHSTGEFKRSYFDGYGECAKRFYCDNFTNVEEYFYSN